VSISGQADIAADLKILMDEKTNDTKKSEAVGRIMARYTIATAGAGALSNLDMETLMKTLQKNANGMADKRYEFQEFLVEDLGRTSRSSQDLLRLQNQIYDEDVLRKKSMDDAGPIYARYFETPGDAYAEFLGAVNENNMLLTHYIDKTTDTEALDLVLYGKALGYKKEALQSFLERQFAMTGKADETLLKQTLAYSNAVEKKTGISSKIIAENVSVMMKDISTFGAMSSKEMNKAAAAVAHLGVKMGTVSGLVKGFSNFEDAAGNVAKLTQALGIQLDVMEMVEMSNSGDSTGMIEMLKEQFDASDIDVHALSLPMKRVISEMLSGGDINEMEKMFGKASNGLSDFLDVTDEALSGVEQNQFDTSLADAESNIRKLDGLKGDIKTTMDKAFKHITETLAVKMSGVTKVAKDELREMVFESAAVVGKAAKGGLFNEVLKGFKSQLKLSLGEVRVFLEDLNDMVEEGDVAAIRKLLGIKSTAELALEDKQIAAAVSQANLISNLVNTAQAKVKEINTDPAYTTSVQRAQAIEADPTLDADTTLTVSTEHDVQRIMEQARAMDANAVIKDKQTFNDESLKALEKALIALTKKPIGKQEIIVRADDGLFKFVGTDGTKFGTVSP
jgi:hypothetical protein